MHSRNYYKCLFILCFFLANQINFYMHPLYASQKLKSFPKCFIQLERASWQIHKQNT